MLIKGLQKLTLLDFPEKIACTVFLGGCNFRCPYCHNASLVIPEKFGEDISEEDFFGFLEMRRGRLEGVCVSGGEPTLHKELPSFIEKIKSYIPEVKLDTNGTNPEMLEELIMRGLVDYVAMDIKNSREKYPMTVGKADFDLSAVERRAEILMRGKIPFEFRTTVVRELHTSEDIESVGRWLSGNEKFYLQTFKDSGDLISSGMSAYSDGEMDELLKILQRCVPEAKIRGVE